MSEQQITDEGRAVYGARDGDGFTETGRTLMAQMTEAQQRMVTQGVEAWNADWGKLVRAVADGTGLSPSEAMLYMVLSHVNMLGRWAAVQLEWWNSDDRKERDAAYAEHNEQMRTFAGEMMELLRRERDDDWRQDDT